MRRAAGAVAVMLAVAAVVSPWLQSAGVVLQKSGAADDAASCYSLAAQYAALSKGTRGSETPEVGTLGATDGVASGILWRSHPGALHDARPSLSSSSIALFLLHRHLTI